MRTLEEPLNSEPPAEIPASAERAALERILASRHFAKAPLLSSFLRFVGEASLSNPEGRVTEQEIGVQVFHRDEDYDPGEDNIVRNYARQLRKRLEAYYANEGAAEPIQIDIPKGGYTAVFRRQIERQVQEPSVLQLNESPDGDSASTESIAEPLAKRPSTRRMGIWLRPAVIALYALGALILFAGGAATERHFSVWLEPSPLHSLWTTLFQSDRDTVVVPADIGFVILQQLNNRAFSLAEYENWPSVEQYDHIYTSFLKAQKYTSVLDLESVSRIQRLPEVVPSRFSVRAARTLTMEDLVNDNVLLLGSSYSNPWVTVFEPTMNFRFMNQPAGGRSWIQNVRPLSGETATYEGTTRSITHETFAVIALRQNIGRSGRVLIVEGLDGPGTQAAMDLLMDGTSLLPIVKKAMRRDGTIGSFEVLLSATSLGDRATGTRVIAERYAP
jgi:hypothetical protein